ncbi:unnamed protein product [Cylindrotheca closterium]|uniref:Ig-like domain-containing protein n=1 Tax=Cylindrotheca closterium TaxID=2856 RepID=A0AAD2G5U3_9STRA|nr:unnamed protein product [Cylindrotheca closterium]
MKYQRPVFLLPLALVFLLIDWNTSTTSVSNGSSSEKTSSLSCFEQLQGAENQGVQWQTENENATSNGGKKSLAYSCPKLYWEHDTHDSTCQVNSFDPRSFLSTFRGRTLVFAGDSLSAHPCKDLQDTLKGSGYDSSQVNTSYSSDPFRKGILHGCQEFENGVLICCSWLAFSNAKKERYWANIKLFSAINGIALNVLDPSDLMIWNTGLHHTSHYSGTIGDMTWLVNNTLSDWKTSKSLASVPTLWWKECYAQHFKNGHWDSWSDVQRYKTAKYKNLKRQCYDISKLSVENETGIYNEAAEPVVRSFGVPILRVHKASIPLHRQHFNAIDCTHFCLGKHGPYDHDHALMTKLIEAAIAGGNLPALPKERSEKNQFDLQHRWDLLMEHPTDSLMAKMDVCAKSKKSKRPPSWKAEKDGLPPPLKKCLRHSEKVHGGGLKS